MLRPVVAGIIIVIGTVLGLPGWAATTGPAKPSTVPAAEQKAVRDAYLACFAAMVSGEEDAASRHAHAPDPAARAALRLAVETSSATVALYRGVAEKFGAETADRLVNSGQYKGSPHDYVVALVGQAEVRVAGDRAGIMDAGVSIADLVRVEGEWKVLIAAEPPKGMTPEQYGDMVRTVVRRTQEIVRKLKDGKYKGVDALKLDLDNRYVFTGSGAPGKRGGAASRPAKR